MGKIRKARAKYHISAPKCNNQTTKPQNSVNLSEKKDLKEDNSIGIQDNIFAGININFNSLNTKLSDDTRSVRSFKSIKSELGVNKVTKKDKLKLRKELFMKKMDAANEIKKETKKRKKRKSVAIIGDTNALHDALPDLQSLLKDTTESNMKGKQEKPIGKSKPIQKATKRRKDAIQNIKTFKMLMKNKQFTKNPLQTITMHLQAKVKQL